MGAASKTGNGSLWIDGRPYSFIKDGQVIPIGSGTHSIRYVPTLKKSEWTTTVTFGSNTVLIANVIDEDFSAPKFETYDVTNEKLAELEELSKKQKEEKEKEDSTPSVSGVAKVIGVILVVLVIAAACGIL